MEPDIPHALRLQGILIGELPCLISFSIVIHCEMPYTASLQLQSTVATKQFCGKSALETRRPVQSSKQQMPGKHVQRRRLQELSIYVCSVCQQGDLLTQIHRMSLS